MFCELPDAIPQSSPAAACPGVADADFVQRIAGGDQPAIEELYRDLSKLVEPQVKYRLRGLDEGDLLHEALTIVVEQIRKGGLRNPAALRSYAGSVIRNLVAGRIVRAIWTRRRTVQADSTLPQLHSASADPESLMLQQEQGELIRRGLKTLRSRDSEVLTRFYLRGQPYSQICDEMQLTETQFRLVKSRAKAKLTAWARSQDPALPV